MYLVGLTGGIGSGKSTVSRLLRERGITVVDADRIARDVVRAGSEGFERLVERFGEEVVAGDGELDRQRLADIVFEDDAARDDLDDIVHPLVGERIGARLAELRGTEEIVVLDVPLLVESGMHEGCDAVIVVSAPEDVRVERLRRDRGMDPSQVRARIRAQATDEDRRAAATHVIDNSGDLDDLERQVDGVLADLRDENGGKETA